MQLHLLLFAASTGKNRQKRVSITNSSEKLFSLFRSPGRSSALCCWCSCFAPFDDTRFLSQASSNKVRYGLLFFHIEPLSRNVVETKKKKTSCGKGGECKRQWWLVFATTFYYYTTNNKNNNKGVFFIPGMGCVCVNMLCISFYVTTITDWLVGYLLYLSVFKKM